VKYFFFGEIANKRINEREIEEEEMVCIHEKSIKQILFAESSAFCC
jgi:hypothetical protein